jgi:ribosome-binding factor A
MSRRTERVGEQIRAEVARLLREEVTDPRIGLLSVTRVDVAPDLSNARVFWSAFEGPRQPTLEQTAAGLVSAAPFLRRQLSRIMSTKRVPELRFEHDPSLAAGAEMLALISELSHESKE